MAEGAVVRGMFLGKGRINDVTIRDGKVTDISPARRGGGVIGSKTSIIMPSLFDIQVNGAAGASLQGPDVTVDDVRKVSDYLAASGVSHWVPTVITASLNDMEHSCRILAEAMADKTLGRAIPGIHLEGPCISPVDGPRGAHPKAHVRKPNLRDFDRLEKAAQGKVLYTTVAPELERAPEYIAALTKRGVAVSLGHHNGSAEDVERAADAGAVLCTHLGNGLASQLPRHENPLWPQLAEDRLKASLIADLHHLPPPVLKTFVRAKAPANIILTSDCVHIAGLPPDNYELAGQEVSLNPDGRICLSGTDLLAGSSLMLLQGVVNAVRVTDMSLQQAYASASTIPAKLFGLKHRFQLPSVGKRPNLIVFELDTTGVEWELQVHGVFIDGERRG